MTYPVAHVLSAWKSWDSYVVRWMLRVVGTSYEFVGHLVLFISIRMGGTPRARPTVARMTDGSPCCHNIAPIPQHCDPLIGTLHFEKGVGGTPP